MGHYRVQDDPPRGRSRPRGARDAYYDDFNNDINPGMATDMAHGPRFRSSGTKSTPQSPTRPTPLSDPYSPQGRRRVPRPTRRPASLSPSPPPPRRRARPRTTNPMRSPSPDKSRRPLRRHFSDDSDQDRRRYSRAEDDARPPRDDTKRGFFRSLRRRISSSPSPSPVREPRRQKQQGYPEREAGGTQRRRYQPTPWQEGNEDMERRDIRRDDGDDRRDRRGDDGRGGDRRGDDRRGDDRRGTWAYDKRADRERDRDRPRRSARDEEPRARRTRSEEPSRRARPSRPSPQPDASRAKKAKPAKAPGLDIPWQALAMTAVQAGATAAFKARRDPGPWMGPKGTKVATAAIGAAIADGFAGNKVRRKK